MRRARGSGLLACLVAMAPSNARAQAPDGAEQVFRRYADRVSIIQVVELGSGAKAQVGSAFYVSSRGHLITNYHVVANVVHEPTRYRAELVNPDGANEPVSIEAVNVVDDMAVVRTDRTPSSYFELRPAAAAHGARLYSFGNPLDLGIAIVEGTHNGLLKHTLYPRIHFSGALNPGMSGGPTITARGDVIGINVSTAGNEVSFLVPSDRALALLTRATDPAYHRPSSFLPVVAEQLLTYQDAYVGELFVDSSEQVVLGPYRLPTKPAPFFNCWADAERSENIPYEVVTHECSTDDYVFVSRDQASGIVEFRHRFLESDELNRFQFAALASSEFQGAEWVSRAGEEDVTPFRCRTRNVSQDGLQLRASFCVRRYRKLEGLYDAVLRAVTIDPGTRGFVTTLSLSGVSSENVERVARRYMESIGWNDH